MTKLSDYINGLTEDTTPDTSNDMLLEYDASATACKKVKLSTVTSGLSAGLGADGWEAADAMTYASADAPTFTMTCAGDQTGKYSVGMRVKLTQTTVKYFIITAVAYSSSTTITLYGGTDYTLTSAAITSPYYSSAKAPIGFPLDPTKWTVEVTDTTIRTQATPTQNTWYNLGSVSISVPIGMWRVYYSVVLSVADASLAVRGASTLSTGNNSESDADFTCIVDGPSQGVTLSVSKEKFIGAAAKTAYYLNSRTTLANMDNLYNRNDLAKAIVRATCAYL